MAYYKNNSETCIYIKKKHISINHNKYLQNNIITLKIRF